MQPWFCKFFRLGAAFLLIAVMGVVAGETTTFQCFAVQVKLDSSSIVGLL